MEFEVCRWQVVGLFVSQCWIGHVELSDYGKCISSSVSEKYISPIQKVMWWVMSMTSCWIICFSMLDWSIGLVWLWWIDFSVSEKYISLIQKVMWVMSMASCWIICFRTTRPLVMWICLIMVNVFLCFWTKYFSDSRSYVDGKLLDYLFPDHLSVGQLLLPAGNSTIPSISGSRVCHTYKSVWHTFESVRHTLKSVCSRVCHQCATQICLAHLSLCHTCYMVQKSVPPVCHTYLCATLFIWCS